MEVNRGAMGPCLRIWECRDYAVVLGMASRYKDDVVVKQCRRDGVPILRRCTGGGTVLIGPGCLNFTLALPVSSIQHRTDIRPSMKAILSRIAGALSPAAGRIEHQGISDLTANNLKFSGNAQRWLRAAFLHQGTILYDFDVDRVTRYLAQPKRQPDYRNDRPHGAFIENLPIHGQRPGRLIADAWNACKFNGPLPHEIADDLVRRKYRSNDWIFRH